MYTLSGLVAAAVVTRYVLPALVPPSLQMRSLDQPGRRLERALEGSRRLRWLPLALALAAVAVVYLNADRIWNRNLSTLSPIAKADQRLDEQLRGDLGAPDLQFMVAFSAPDQERALAGAEKAGAVLRRLQDQGDIAGFTSPALVLPSQAAQRVRQAALPEADELQQRLRRALDGIPVSPEKLQGFVADTQAARAQHLLTRADLEGTSAALLLDSLLIKRASDYLVLIPLRAPDNGNATPIDVDRLQAALQATRLPDIVVIDLLEESTRLFENYRDEVLHLSWVGGLVILALLLGAFKTLPRTMRVVVPLLCAIATVTAATLLAGTQLTILHLVGLLLVFAIGSNYALFFERGNEAESPAERRAMLVSLAVANLTAVGSFGILGLSSIPVLSAIGATVSLGTLLSLLFAAMLSHGKNISE
jgi:predicted exporter